MEVYNNKHTYKAITYLTICNRMNYYHHYNGVIAPASYYYDSVTTNFNLRVKYFFTFDRCDD